MQKAAALGLSCKEAFAVFSQHETLALQRRVDELTCRLEAYETKNRGERDVDACMLFDAIKKEFDALYPVETRAAPVMHEFDASRPLILPRGGIWAGEGGSGVSLLDVITTKMQLFVGERDEHGLYCRRQSSLAMHAIRSALAGGYKAAGWQRFHDAALQEHVLWHALMQYFEHVFDKQGSGTFLWGGGRPARALVVRLAPRALL